MGHWATPHLEKIGQSLNELDRVLHLCIQGIGNVAKSDRLVEALVNLDRTVPGRSEEEEQEAQQQISHAKERAEFARNEVDRGFPVLHAHTTVALWGTLECGIDDLIVVFLKRDPTLLSSPDFANIKVPLGVYSGMDEDERLTFLAYEFRKQAGGDFRGIGRFEVLLNAVKLGGGVDAETRKHLLELQQLRNSLVHRAGIVDRRLVDCCPWLSLKIGDRIVISYSDYVRYRTAVAEYLGELVRRLMVQHGLTREEAERRVPPEKYRHLQGGRGGSGGQPGQPPP